MAKNDNTPKIPAHLVALAEANGIDDAVVIEVATLSEVAQERFATLVTLPANTPMSRIADVLVTKPKAFRGWARQTRKLGVSGHAGGCDHQVPTHDDFLAMVKRYCKKQDA